MKIKICHMTSAHDSTDMRIFQKECVSLAAEPDFVVTLIAPGESRVQNGVNIIGMGPRPESRIERMFKYTKKVYEEAIRVDADIYHFHDPELLTAGMKLKRMGKHVVYDSHENVTMQIKVKQYIPALLRPIAATIYHRKETKVCRAIDAVVAPAMTEKDLWFEGRANRIIAVDNLPSLNELHVDYSHKEPRTFCCIGSLNPDRGVTQMLEACRLIDGKLILAGAFVSEQYRRELEEANLLDGVDYRGKIRREEVIEIYNRSQLGLNTILPVGQYNHIKNCATKEYECMAAGIPVVRTDLAGTREIFRKYDYGIAINPYNPKEIADAVTYLLDNPEICRQKGANGRKAAEERFNWEREAKKISQLYREIATVE